MKIMIVTDAWAPQVNGVVRTLMNTKAQLVSLGHEVSMVTPDQFKTFPCPTYPEIKLAWRPSAKMQSLIEQFNPDCLHIATEGPLGWAARTYALRSNRPFTTAYHTKFPEYVKARFGIPLWFTYAIVRHFHKPSESVMVATPSVENTLIQYGFRNLKRWSRGVDLARFNMPISESKLHESHGLIGMPVSGRIGQFAADWWQPAKRPVFLFAGRVAVEKNIEAFLKLDLPGEKWVAGDGPQRAKLEAKYPDVKWLGMLDQDTLARAYQLADVFVFPSLTDTFGLVLLEAMACGLPVAAYPVTGPLDVVGNSGAGVLDEDLYIACIQALDIPKEKARQHAERFSWPAASNQFFSNLKPIDHTRVVRAHAAVYSATSSAASPALTNKATTIQKASS